MRSKRPRAVPSSSSVRIPLNFPRTSARARSFPPSPGARDRPVTHDPLRKNRGKYPIFSFLNLDKSGNQAYCMASKDRIRRFLPQKPRTSLKKTT